MSKPGGKKHRYKSRFFKDLGYITYPPSCPAATCATTDCGTTIPGSGSCTITITPGATATTDGTNPCSVGGKVLTTFNQAEAFPSPLGKMWSSNNSGGYDGGPAIYGISQNSTILSASPNTNFQPGQLACNGNTDGVCDTHNILIFYSSVDPSFYAAGLCTQTINGFSD